MPGNDDCDCCSRLPLTRLAPAFFFVHKTHFLLDYNSKRR
jgi:hypothetical protein